MLIKSAADRSDDIEALKLLLSHPSASEKTRQSIELEIKKIRAGVRAESDASREIDSHFGEGTRNWAVIHDLRLDFDGHVSQIDHLIIGRFLDIFVCESKNFSQGVAINSQGEFTAFFAGKPRGLPSPIEQNRRHIDVLDRLFKSGRVKLPTRLGFSIAPSYQSLILVSSTARIARPKNHVEGIDAIIKNDQVITTINKWIDRQQSPLTIGKVISPETLHDLGHQIAAQHSPITFNWAAKFGFSEATSSTKPASPLSTPKLQEMPALPLPDGRVEPTFSPSSAESNIDHTPLPSPPPDTGDSSSPPPKRLFCAKCRCPVPFAVAKFCWQNKGRFGGKVYCIPHQTDMRSSSS
jgi:hypothetical protein